MILNIDDWKFDINLEETRVHSSLYSRDHCTCAYCENYYRSIDAVYPELRSFLAGFGAVIEGPVELMPFEPTLYLASYRVFGQILSFGNGPMMVGRIPVMPVYDNETRFHLEVGEIPLPWVMLEDMDEVISPANEPEFLEKMYRRMMERNAGSLYFSS